MICPDCGCPYFTGTGSSTADNTRAWKDDDGKWYHGPSNEFMNYRCDSNCGYSYTIKKEKGKVISDSRENE